MKRNQVAAMIIAALLFASTKTAFAQASAALDEYGLRAGHSSPINSLAFSADGNVLHSVASDSSWRTWDAASGKARSGRVLESRGWTGGTIDPAASRVLMRTPLLYAFDLQTGVKVGGVSPIYDRSIVAFAPNPDWSIIVTSERNGDAIIWDLKTGREMIRKRIHSHNLVSGFTFTRGGAAILCNTGLSGIYVWYPFKGEVEQAIPSDFDITPNIVLTVGKNGADGFVALRRGKVEHWDVVTGILNKAPLRVLDEQGEGARIFAVANDASLAAAAYKDGTVKVWRLADGFRLAEFKPSSGSDPDALAFAPGGKSIAIAYGKGELEVWDLSAKRLAWRAERHNPTAPQPVVATGGRRLTASGKKLLLVEGGSAPREIGTHDDFVCAIALSDDGRVAASAAWGGGLALWDTATGKVVWKGATAGREACSLSLSPTGDLIAAGFVDGSCLVLDAAFGKEQASLPAAVDSPVASIALAPAGARALYTNKQAALFNLAGSAILAVTSDTYDVRLPAFSADGRSAALYAWGRLRKDGWLKDSGLMVFSSFDSKPSIKFHKEQPSDEDNAVSTLALSPDGSIVAAGTKSGRGYAFTARYGARFDLKSPLPGPVTGVTFLSGGETRRFPGTSTL